MTTTSNKGYTLPTVGGDTGTWGTELNSNFSIIDSNFGGAVTINCAGSSNVTVSSGQAQNLILNLTGALTGNIELILPSVGGFYVIQNNCSGGFTITVQTGGVGSTVNAIGGTDTLVYCDGTNVTIPQTNTQLPAWQVISSNTVSAAATVPIAMPTTYSRFRLTCQQVYGSVNGALVGLRFSTNGGSTYVTTNNYLYTQQYVVYGSAATSGYGQLTYLPISGTTQSPPSGYAWDSVSQIWPGVASTYAPRVTTVGCGMSSSGSFYTLTSGGENQSGFLANYIEVFMSGGTITGTFIMEGLAP